MESAELHPPLAPATGLPVGCVCTSLVALEEDAVVRLCHLSRASGSQSGTSDTCQPC